MFMQSFKYYKSRQPKPDFKDVIDLDAHKLAENISEIDLQENALEIENSQIPGLEPVHKWRVFQLTDHPGLIVIRNAFSCNGQRYWMARCLRDFPKNPNRKNLSDRLFQPKVLSDWWRELHDCGDTNEKRRMKIGLRWVTLGYHHNWDTKVYSEKNKTEFPADLAEMCNYFAAVLGFESFLAQAAIVNYYPIGTTLAGHTDNSEANLDAPLFSFSFGQDAIFLIGGQTKDEKPAALFLKNSDVLVMSHEARICYHAVPRVMRAKEETYNLPFEDERNCEMLLPRAKRLRSDIDFIIQQNDKKLSSSTFDFCLYHLVRDETFWLPFRNYLNDSRININVRQVLHQGELTLAS